MQLVALVVFAIMLVDVIRKYSKELMEYAAVRKSQPEEAKYCLSNTYDFLVTGLVYMDSMIMVMAIASINTDSVMDMALLFAIPFTAYRVGSWIGSVMTSPLIGRFGEKRMGVFAAVISAATFLGMSVSLYQKNVYIFAACKFLEGICQTQGLYIYHVIGMDELISGGEAIGMLIEGENCTSRYIGTEAYIGDGCIGTPSAFLVAVSIFAALKYIFRHPDEGILYPEQLDADEIISCISPYLPVISKECWLLDSD